MRHVLTFLKNPETPGRLVTQAAPAPCSFASPCGYCAIVRPDLIG
jgi:hypothetical protein